MQNLYDPDTLYATDPQFRMMVDRSGLFGPDVPISSYATNMRSLMDQYLTTTASARDAVMQSNGLYGNYGTAGPVTMSTTNMSGADLGYGGGIVPGQVGAYPGQETAYADLQSKYPGYAQVAGLSAGADEGGSGIRSYYDPATAITDPVYGLIAPVTATGQAGKKGVGFMQQGGAVLAAMLGAGLGSSFLSSYLGGAGDVAGAAGSTGSSTPLIGSGSLIPDYTGGIAANAGNFGTGVTSGTIGATGIPGLSLSNLGTLARLGGGITSLLGGGGVGGSGSGGGGSGGLGNVNSLFDLAQQLAGAGIGYASSNRLADQLMHVAERAGQLGDPLQQQPRIPYQGQLSNLLTPEGAKSFMSTDPGVLGMMDQANNAFQGQASKAGSGGTTYTNYLRNISDILGSQYNNRINQLTNLGGFQFAPNPGGYGQIGTMSALYNAGGLGSLGNLLGGGTPTLNTLLNGGSVLGNGIGDLYSSLSSLFGGTADTSGFTSTYDPISNYFGNALNTTGSTNMTGFMGNMFGNSSSDFGNLLDTNSLWSLS